MSKKLPISVEQAEKQYEASRMASIKGKEYQKRERRKFFYNYLKLIPNDDIIRFTMMAMEHVDKLKSESDLERTVYQYCLYYNHETNYCPFVSPAKNVKLDKTTKSDMRFN